MKYTQHKAIDRALAIIELPSKTKKPISKSQRQDSSPNPKEMTNLYQDTSPASARLALTLVHPQ